MSGPKRRTLRDREADAVAQQRPPAAGGTTRLGTYWRLATFEAAKAAYLADLDTLAQAPDSFARWIDAALTDHAALSPERRAKLARTLPREAEGQGVSRSFILNQTTVTAMEEAMVADRKTTGWVYSRTEFMSQAVRAAITEARTRYGTELPAPPARLPNKPPR